MLVDVPTRAQLWKRRTARFPPVPASAVAGATERIIAIAPEAIDVVNARHGHTLRYFGLPFARVRQLLGTERIWFGVDGLRRRMLDHTAKRC